MTDAHVQVCLFCRCRSHCMWLTHAVCLTLNRLPSLQPTDAGEILLTGWFVKRGDDSMLSRRRKRFFVLRASHVEYYAQEGTRGEGHDPKGRIDLAATTTVELRGDKAGHLVGLAVMTHDRVFSLSAISPGTLGAAQTASVDERVSYGYTSGDYMVFACCEGTFP